MENAGITPVMNVGGGYGYGDGCFGGNGLWLFAILALMNGGFGGWGANRFADGRAASVEDLQNTSNFARLESQVQGNGTAITTAATNLGNGICQLGYQLATDFGAMSKEMAECCCGINRNIDGVNYNVASQAAAINANVTAQVQSIKDMLAAEKAQALQAQVNRLEMEKMFCGVPKIQPATVYGAVPASYGFNFGCGCGCGNY